MTDTGKTSFPMLPVKHWWALRERFKGSIPGVVTPNYIASALNMKEESARANVVLPLRMLGFIDDEGRTDQELAVAWRDDKRYEDVCKEILHKVYPAELIDAAPRPSTDRSAVERWLANRTGAGKAAVKRMAALYTVLAEPNLEARPTDQKAVKRITRDEKAPKRTTRARVSKQPLTRLSPEEHPHLPGLAINLQIHISSDATPDQIDKIFESMAKHIYSK